MLSDKVVKRILFIAPLCNFCPWILLKNDWGSGFHIDINPEEWPQIKNPAADSIHKISLSLLKIELLLLILLLSLLLVILISFSFTKLLMILLLSWTWLNLKTSMISFSTVRIIFEFSKMSLGLFFTSHKQFPWLLKIENNICFHSYEIK